MSFKKFGRLACALAVAGIALSIPLTMAGCNTNHPEAKITILYGADDAGNPVEYVLNYKLYRNMYPQTVRHFIELADSGFYDNTIIHDNNTDSNSQRWLGGGYDFIMPEGSTFDEAKKKYETAWTNSDDLLDYLKDACKEKEYDDLAKQEGKLTPSVYLQQLNGVYSQPLTTLIGEFSDNGHTIEKGALTRSPGCLSMFYYAKDGDKVSDALGGTEYVPLKKDGTPAGFHGKYTHNTATSIFGIQYGTSTASIGSYCVFGTLKSNDSFEALKTAVGSSYKSTKPMFVDNYDAILGANSTQKEFRVFKSPVVVTSVKITKY